MAITLRRAAMWAFVYFCLCALFVALFSTSTSPLLRVHEIDSDLFQYMGWAWTSGRVPYIDYFDHKGLLLYAINAVGWLISPRYGVALLQVLNLMAVCVVWHWGIVALRASWRPFLLVLLGLYLVYGCYMMGNKCEEWSLLFQSLPFALYFRSERLSWRSLLAIGVCGGCLCLLRLNNAAPVCGLLLWCAAVAVWRREWRYLLRAVCLVFVGALLPLVASAGVMCGQAGWQGVEEMWYANVTFNMEYVAGYVPSDASPVKWCARFGALGLTTVAGCCLAVAHRRLKPAPQAGALLMAVAVSAVAMVGHAAYNHYFMVFVPLLVYAAGMVRGRLAYVWLALVLVLNAFQPVYHIYKGRPSQVNHSDFPAVLSRVLRDVPPSDRAGGVWNIDGAWWDQRAVMSAGVLQCNRVFHPFQYGLSSRLRADEARRFCAASPRWLLTVQGSPEMLTQLLGVDVSRYALHAEGTTNEGLRVRVYRLKD